MSVYTTWRKEPMTRKLFGAAALLLFVMMSLPATAGAIPDPEFGKGCDTTATGSLIDQFGYLTICDGHIQPDGSWERTRLLWGRSNRVCYPVGALGRRNCTDMADVPIHEYSRDVYRVTPDTVPPGEPGEPGWIE